MARDRPRIRRRSGAAHRARRPPGHRRGAARARPRRLILTDRDPTTRRLLLVRHAETEGLRRGLFGDTAPLHARGVAAARALAPALPRCQAVLSGPGAAASATAELLAPSGAAEPDPLLADWDAGTWAGRAAEDVAAADPVAFAAWRTDPDAGAPGGEPLRALLARVAGFLERAAGTDARITLAVTHAAVVRAALVAALGAPAQAFWSFDVAPLGLTELHASGGRWRVCSVNAHVVAPAPVEVPA